MRKIKRKRDYMKKRSESIKQNRIIFFGLLLGVLLISLVEVAAPTALVFDYHSNESSIALNPIPNISEEIVSDEKVSNESEGTVPVEKIVNMSEENENVTKVIDKVITIHLEQDAIPLPSNYDKSIITVDSTVVYSIAKTQFSWEVNQEQLCTKWETYSKDTENISTACYGAEQCCNYKSLFSAVDEWDGDFSFYYGKNGAGYKNSISAQVIYVDENNSGERSNAEIVESMPAEHPIQFVHPVKSILTYLKDLVVSAMSAISGTNLKISTILVDSEEEPLTFQAVDFYVNETLQDSELTDSQGYVEFELNTTNLIPSKYLLEINFPGQTAATPQETIQYLSSNDSIVIEILPEDILPVDILPSNISLFNETNEIKILEISQGEAEIGKPVEWIQKIEVTNNISADQEILIGVTLPAEAEEIYIKDETERDRILPETETNNLNNNKSIEFTDEFSSKEEKKFEVRYETPAPEKTESKEIFSEGKITKNITISSEASMHYYNVFSYTDIPETKKEQVKFYWIINDSKINVVEDQRFNVTLYDTNNNGLVDKITWIVPQLSEQLFILEIIPITTAMHLDYNRQYIADLYDYVWAKDDRWTYAINNDEYVRITFGQELDHANDITIYARGEGSILVYEYEKNETIALFENIRGEGKYKVYLTNLIGIQDTFDLKVVGSVEFDYIVDPGSAPAVPTLNAPASGSTISVASPVTLNVTVTDPDGDNLNVTFWSGIKEMVTEGTSFGCGVLNNGSAICWGIGSSGQMGNGLVTTSNNNPVFVNTSNRFSSVYASSGQSNLFACGVLINGSIMCWGNNAYNQLGDGTTTQRNNPVLVNTTS